ncbi:MAG: hypothetical protein CO129_01460 [Ignavibacteriales bacterium CG_4_9_14_3_um_filter_34_10]|nr:MAG: hypothetical protein CO129_01460 [Ignavibacteriales bacterium CG_4_9_14_3_um_filter_34_10]
MSKFKSSVAVYIDFINLMKSTFDKEIFSKFFERISHSMPIDEDETIDDSELAAFYFKTNQKINFLYDLALTYSEKYLFESELINFEYKLALILSLYRKNELAAKLIFKILSKTEEITLTKQFIAKCNLLLGEVFAAEADWRQSDRHLKLAKGIFEELNDYDGIAECEFLFGSIYLEKGDIEIGEIRLESAERFFINDENALLKAKLLNNRGILNSIRENFPEAKKYFEESLKIFESLNNLPMQAESKLNLGIVNFNKNELEIALKQFNDAKILAIRSLSIQTVALALMYKANVYLKKQSLLRALKMTNQAKAISYQINDTLTVADLFKINGIVNIHLGKNEVAEDMLLTSLRINNELGNKLNSAETSVELGHLYRIMKKYDQAKMYFENAIDYYTKIGSEKLVKGLNISLNSLKYL